MSPTSFVGPLHRFWVVRGRNFSDLVGLARCRDMSHWDWMRSGIRGVVLLLALSSGVGAETWLPLTDKDLEVKAGSALDFSVLSEVGPAGKYGWAKATPEGHISFERRAIPHRFFCASFAFSPSSGGMPTADMGKRIAVQLRRTGYNLVRLHFVDAMLMSGREQDFDLDQTQLDRFFRFVAALKEEGIYWVIDGLTSDNGAYGDADRNRWKKKHNLKRDLLFDAKAQAHWTRLTTDLWGRKNPYTGLSTLQDTALLGVILVNEGTLGFLATTTGNKWPDELGPAFAEWVKGRYPNDAAMRSAWGGDAEPGDSVSARSLSVPRSVRAQGARANDFMRFVGDLERVAFKRMDAHVRSLGFSGLTTAYDVWGFFHADVTRANAGWIDMHTYAELPSAFSQPGSKIAHVSSFDKGGRWVRELTQSRQWGKPFTVSEWGQPFWNRWRHESVALMPAIAAHQGWDAICHFADNPLLLSYTDPPGQRQSAIQPFGVGVDPVLRVGERLAALLFLRGDVAASDARLRLSLDPEAIYSQGRGWEQVPESIGRLTLAVPSGLDIGTDSKSSSGRELLLGAAKDGAGWIRTVGKVASRLRLSTGPIEDLRDTGLLPKGNVTDPARGLIQTDTGQLRFDSNLPQLTIVTDRSLVIVTRGGDAAVEGFALRGTSTPGLFAVSSLDGERVGASQRLLVFVLTDAINSGMTFQDVARTTIRTLGKVPPLVVPVRTHVSIASSAMAEANVYPLSLAGERRGPALQATRSDGVLQFDLDTARLEGGPALMFEIVPR